MNKCNAFFFTRSEFEARSSAARYGAIRNPGFKADGPGKILIVSGLKVPAS
jgi:hypothetical protein